MPHHVTKLLFPNGSPSEPTARQKTSFMHSRTAIRQVTGRGRPNSLRAPQEWTALPQIDGSGAPGTSVGDGALRRSEKEQCAADEFVESARSKMTQATTPAPSQSNGRPTKFTPERIQQIKNLVERGKSRHEIAELLDISVGSLEAACLRWGISLQRAFLENGVALRRPGRFEVRTVSPPPAGQHQHVSQPQAPSRAPHRARMESQQADLADFTVRVQYKGRERAIKLPLTECMISHLALRAELRQMRIGELISELLMAAIKTDMLQLVLDGQGCSEHATA
jgi:helix-turn-helix resolvase-like protein